MKKLVVCVCLFALSGCGTLNLGNTVAGGACGTVDYSIIFMGAPLLGIQAVRGCDEDEGQQPDNEG